MVVLGDSTANHKTDPLILTTYLVLRHQFRFKRCIDHLYNERELSAREIAAKLDSSHHSINSAIKRFGIIKPEKIRRPRFGRASPYKSEAKLKHELKVIQQIKLLNKQGLSLRKIADKLNHLKIETPSGKGQWVQSTIKRILK